MTLLCSEFITGQSETEPIGQMITDRHSILFVALSLNLQFELAGLKSYGHRAFSFGAVVEWNKLPLDLRQLPSVAVFKSRLKTYLFEKCYA